MAITLAVELAFSSFSLEAKSLGHYLTGVGPCVARDKVRLLPTFVRSLSITSVSLYTGFVESLVTGACHHRQDATREFLSRGVEKQVRQRIAGADLGQLIALAAKRVSFEGGGGRIEALFHGLFGFSAWESDGARVALMDLVILRNIFVHRGDSVTETYASQISRQDVFEVKRWGDLPALFTVQHEKVLAMLPLAFDAMQRQEAYFRQQLEARTEWRDEKASQPAPR